ncbi:MAG: S8 family peptidase, partial [Ignavibacterium sp.]|nr:S8 family peptidase [Ignavibacterium sp.]MDW8376221.1 S8 family serine peptidase [Ignavibacteriales bacterium]
YIIFGYEGIVYAANNGAKVINCSWGGGAYSIYGQEIINFAISKGALVVCAAGNSNSIEPFYPAAYNGAFSVASTTNTDAKSSFSNYGRTIDVSSPGSSIYNTWQNNTYSTLSGTSMASPLVAGLAGLVKARFPNFNGLQVGEQIRVNTDNINSVNTNFQFLLGTGRINAFKSLNNINSKSVRAIQVNFSDEQPGGNGDGIFQSGEVITVSAVFMNYLSPTSNLSIQLEPRTSFSTVQNGNVNFGVINTLQQFNNFNNKFTFQISNSTPQNSLLTFLLRYTDGSYSDFQWIEVIANPTYGNQVGNNIKLTITSKGTLAFNDYPNNTQGQGFRYQNSNNQLFEGALILGTSAQRISDAARGANQSVQNSDFAVVQPFTLRIPGNIADVEGITIFNDNNAGTNKIGITTKLNSYSFSQSPYEDFIILDYTLINNTNSQINNLYAGLFFDWDMVDGNGDITNWDANLRYGITRNTTNQTLNWVGVGLISAQNFGFYAIKNDSGDGGFGIYDGFADHEKWIAISSGVSKQNAGPGDVSQVVSSGPYTINPADSVRVAFAIAGGMNKQILDAAIQNARIKYQQIITDVESEPINLPKYFKLEQNYPNPFNPSTKITWHQPENAFVSIKLFNALGEEVDTIIEGLFEAGIHSKLYIINSTLPSGIYFYQLRTGDFVDTKKMILLR